MKVQNVPVAEVHVSRNHRTYTPEGIEELAASIKEVGLQSPIRVRPNENGYEIVYGHRRFEAIQRLGWDEVPAFVMNDDDLGAVINQLVENLQKEDVSSHDKARAAMLLKDEFGLTPEEIAQQLGIDFSTAHKWLKYGEAVVKTGDRLGRDLAISMAPGSTLRIDGEPQKFIEKAALTLDGKSYATELAIVQETNLESTTEDKMQLLEAIQHAQTPVGVRLMAGSVREGRVAPIREERKKREPRPREVRETIRAIMAYQKALEKLREQVEYGKLAPEHIQFVVSKIRLARDMSSNTLGAIQGRKGGES